MWQIATLVKSLLLVAKEVFCRHKPLLLSATLDVEGFRKRTGKGVDAPGGYFVHATPHGLTGLSPTQFL